MAELADIRLYTRRMWGAGQADRYLQGLGNRFREIAAGTAVARDAEIGGGYRRCRYEAHIIIFKEASAFIRVLHVFHERMDIAERLLSGG
jgi:plasmid stabilization system protein ParE